VVRADDTDNIDNVSSSQGCTQWTDTARFLIRIYTSHHWTGTFIDTIWCTAATLLYRRQKQKATSWVVPMATVSPVVAPPLHRPQQEAAGPWRLGSQAVSLEGVARITRGLCIPKTLVSNHGYLICPAPQCSRLSRLIITTHYSSKSGPAHRLPLGWCQTGMTT